jgi:hypothetical protein
VTPLLVDDLPGFLEHPPGTGPPAPAAAPAVATPAGTTAGGAPGGSAAGHSTRSVLLGMVTSALVLVALAAVIALTAGRAPGPATAGGVSPGAGTTAGAPAGTAPTGAAVEPGPDPAVPATVAPATATEPAAASLAFTSLPLGSTGVAASLTFEGVVLEQRAVGLTVTYPSLSLSSDGSAALAHVRLPTFNCLTPEPPADPLAAGCRRSLTEYADLTSPDLQVGRDGDRLEVAGLFPTYTRPNGSAPAYTGRAYRLTAAVSPDGSVRGARAAATGVVRIGLDSAASTPVPGVNVLQFPR